MLRPENMTATGQSRAVAVINKAINALEEMRIIYRTIRYGIRLELRRWESGKWDDR
jgi:hypothetical protein